MTEVENAAAESKSGAWLVLRVFDEPVQVFKELAERPRVLLPIVLAIIVTAIYAYGTPDSVLQEQTRSQMEAFQERGQITDEQIQERVDRAASPGSRGLIFGAGTAGALAAMAIVALVLMLIFGATGPDPIRFVSEFSVILHANIVSLAGAVLMVLLMRFAGMSEPTLSLGFLFDQDTSGYLYRFANQITLFGTWNMLLIALGNQILSKAKSFTGPLFIVGGLWILVKLGFAALGGLGFGG
ncbi:MAG: hypothetical protein JSW51_00600 [Gemmatimonadota bacterium]|nr:MAG: hypothetical protein JSW51_00600 [Gemmatimonadota bacterium]